MREPLIPDLVLHVYGGGRYALRQVCGQQLWEVVIGIVGGATVLGAYETLGAAQDHVERLVYGGVSCTQ